MAKTKRKQAEPRKSPKKTSPRTAAKTNASESVAHLLELHKLQGVLLARLSREV